MKVFYYIIPTTSVLLVALFGVFFVEEFCVVEALASGFGATNSKNKKANKKSSKLDASASLLRCEVQYEELLNQYDNPNTNDNEDEDEIDTNCMEYIIAAKCPRVPGFQDWVPIAQLVLVMGTGFESALSLQKALSLHCREVHAAGIFAAPVLGGSTASRKDVEYSAEPLSTWQKFVYEDVIEQKRKV